MDAPIVWLDLVSPELRRIHEAWIVLRLAEAIPAAAAYNDFAAATPLERSTCAVLVRGSDEPVFKHVGAEIATMAPFLAAGAPFSAVPSVLLRSVWTVPLRRTMDNAKPESRIVTVRRKGSLDMFESLLLPFAPQGGRAALVHAIYDFAPAIGGRA